MNNIRRTPVVVCLLLLGLMARTANTAEPAAENPGSEGDGSVTVGP